MFITSLGLTGFSMFSTHEIPLTVSIGVSVIFLLLKYIDRQKNSQAVRAARMWVPGDRQ